MKKEQTYYLLTIKNFGEYYQYADNALEAIEKTRREFALTAYELGQSRNEHRPLGAITARKAVYGEWKCGLNHYRLDGSHSHDWVNA